MVAASGSLTGDATETLQAVQAGVVTVTWEPRSNDGGFFIAAAPAIGSTMGSLLVRCSRLLASARSEAATRLSASSRTRCEREDNSAES